MKDLDQQFPQYEFAKEWVMSHLTFRHIWILQSIGEGLSWQAETVTQRSDIKDLLIWKCVKMDRSGRYVSTDHGLRTLKEIRDENDALLSRIARLR